MSGNQTHVIQGRERTEKKQGVSKARAAPLNPLWWGGGGDMSLPPPLRYASVCNTRKKERN